MIFLEVVPPFVAVVVVVVVKFILDSVDVVDACSVVRLEAVLGIVDLNHSRLSATEISPSSSS